LNRYANINVSAAPLRSSGATTPTNGILKTSKYPNHTSGSITPVGELNDDYSLPIWKPEKKNRVTWLGLSPTGSDKGE